MADTSAANSEVTKSLDEVLLEVHPSPTDTQKVLNPNSDELSETDTEGESLTDSLQGDHDDDGKAPQMRITCWRLLPLLVILII